MAAFLHLPGYGARWPGQLAALPCEPRSPWRVWQAHLPWPMTLQPELFLAQGRRGIPRTKAEMTLEMGCVQPL